jgi:hypothetical protein
VGTRIRVMRGALLGAALQYLLDPQLGRTRRARLADQAGARFRRLLAWTGRKARYQRGKLQGVWHDLRLGRRRGAQGASSSDLGFGTA